MTPARQSRIEQRGACSCMADAPHGLDSGRHLAVHHVTNAGHHQVLMNIQTGAMRVQNFYRSSSCAAGVEPLSSRI